ncbi:hypothetical protein PFFVO_01427, partial [Plasmodium falciparum Vietnam Oak-Knoll (FVO)]
MAAAESGGQGAKDVLEEIGKRIQEQATRDATNEHRNELKGNLALAKFLNGRTLEYANTKVCELSHTHDTNVSWGESNPCYKRLDERFSDEGRNQCTSNRIRDSNDKCGACAPYRKLQLCDYNLEKITDTNTTNTHNLLVDVLLAAKYEGNSLSKYMNENHGTVPKSNVCTVLARSFADIGDIIRGKDLYLGNKKYNETEREKEKLQRNLKYIFKKIYDGLNAKAKEYYSDDKSGNFYQLREDWWNANRLDVWNAITCEAPGDANYFRKTCSSGKFKTSGQCRCIDRSVPTNLDYVPQYLRWFDEWTEDFCRKRKSQLENAIQNCRGKDEYGEEKYCSPNGHDCKTTIRAKDIYSISKECAKCFFSCHRYVKWIDNQKLEFEKQKENYNKEIDESRKTTKESKHARINNIYSNKFYEQLKEKYGTVKNFLLLLNEEKECKNHPNIKDKNYIDFTDEPDEIFSHTEYCQACPWCGLDCNSGTCIQIEPSDDRCKKKSDYVPSAEAKTTEINVLYTGEGNKDILDKLKDFCKTDDKNNIENEKWKCYYENERNNKCVLDADENLNIDKKVKDYVDFMMFWINHMLKDSIDWRKEVIKCINNTTSNKCKKNVCFKNCKCFQKWIEKKLEEWNKIKDHYNNEKDFKEFNPYKTLETILEEDFFKGISEAYGSVDAIERIKKLTEKVPTEQIRNAGNEEFAIDILLKHELEDAKKCINKNPEETCTEDTSHDIDDHFEDDEDDEPPSAPNPCSGDPGGNTTHRSIVKTVAREMHRKAHQEAKGRGLSKLRAHAHLGTYKRGGTGNNFKKLCSITERDSNDSRTDGEPCKGKDGSGVRMKIGTPWSKVGQNKTSYSDVFLPPRREHMCTSNLEKLEVDWVTNKGKASHSLLGDVLLSAKMDAEKIIQLYKEHKKKDELTDPNYQETVCRAIRYSFADLGDIIRGRDMWDLNDGSQKIEKNLKDIFDKIKDNLPDGIKDNRQYNGDPNHIKLREDWWEANRKQIWHAMQCALKSGNEIQCNNHTPIEDYIPQRLRWMNEWAEWYCKEQSMLYNKLVADCGDCMKKGEGGKECMNGSGECRKCKQACEEYKAKIKKWQEQWDKMQLKYLYFYHEAKTTSRHGIDAYSGAVEPKDKPVVKFLQELLPPKSVKPGAPTPTVTSPYSTAAGYIHQEVPHMQCNTLTEFCDNKNGKYTFEDPPTLYKDACNCESRPQVPPKKKEDACGIVEKIYKGSNGGKNGINSCYPKNYNGWNCNSDQFENDHNGACMPPRRQSLCIHNLENDIIGTETKEDDLREAFIKCAAAETCLLWHKYKKDKNDNSNNLDNTLKDGVIPEDFKRQMFYTYGDYRDLCLNTDISSKTNKDRGVGKVKINIDKIFPKRDPNNDTKRKGFWDSNAEAIWKGMLCSLEKVAGKTGALTNKDTYNYKTVTFTEDPSGPNLQTFTTRPQFLRWMTEWGEHFCREHKVEKGKLAAKCGDCAVDPDDGSKCDGECGECQEQCQAYKRWIKTWQDNYKKQKQRYTEVKDNPQYNNDNDVLGTTHAYEYLNKKLDKICPSGTTSANCEYKCMYQRSSTDGMPESLDDTPIEYKDRCTCKDKEAPTPRPSDPPAKEEEQQEEACTIVDNIFKDEDDDYFKEACRQKYKGGKEIDTQWKCTTNKTKKGGQDEVCIPPRRQKLYIKQLKEFSGKKNDELRKAFIECAAVETFFAWHKYKEDKKNEEKKEETSYLVGLGFLGKQQSSPDEEAQKDLESGKIPDEFKRQMFYTFGDYRDIFFGKNMGIDMKTVEEKIKSIFPNSVKPDGQTRETWWNNNAKDIWNGMLCALSYDTKKRIKIEGIYAQLTQNNDYNKVTFDNGNTTLEIYATVPQFIRSFEEWAEEFCRKRKHKLAHIKDDCRSDTPGKMYCSGDGHDCTNEELKHNDMFADSYCPDCKKACRKYNKWIEKKVEEFYNQKSKYKKEHLKTSSNLDNKYVKEFYATSEGKYKSVDSFLDKLKERSHCHMDTLEGKIDFKNPLKTFSSSTYCKTCPLYGVQCRNTSDHCIQNSGNEKKWEHALDTIKIKNGAPTSINVQMIDRRGQYIQEHSENSFKESRLLKSVREQKWECSFVNKKMDVCKLKNFKENIDTDETITFKVLLENWLQDFIEGYYISKRKIDICTKKEEHTAIEGCKSKCECIGKWLKQKTTEWDEIKTHFNKQNRGDGYEIAHKVRNYFEKNAVQLKKWIDDLKHVKKIDDSEDCSVNNDCANMDKETNKDMVSILLSQLKKEIKPFENQPHETTSPNYCDISPTHILTEPSQTDDTETLNPYDETPEDDTSTSSRPNFCPQVEPPPKPEVPQKPEETAEDTTEDTEEEAAAPPVAPSSGEEEAPKEVVPEKKPKEVPKPGPKAPKKRQPRE